MNNCFNNMYYFLGETDVLESFNSKRHVALIPSLHKIVFTPMCYR